VRVFWHSSVTWVVTNVCWERVASISAPYREKEGSPTQRTAAWICFYPLILHFKSLQIFHLGCMEYFELRHWKIYGNKCDRKNFESSLCYLLRVNVLNNNPEYRKLLYDSSVYEFIFEVQNLSHFKDMWTSSKRSRQIYPMKVKIT
jgi:hypothetical protein